MTTLEKTKEYIHKFNQFETQYPGQVANSVCLNAEHAVHVVFVAIVHGDEVGSLPAFIKIIDDVLSKKIKIAAKITFLLGNVPASLQNKRYLDEDLNRAFDEPDNQSVLSLERKRALELMPLLKNCDLVFDFHQTKTPTQFPFYSFGFHEQSYLWARLAGITPMFMTRPANQRFSASGLCMDEFVRMRNVPAVTLELSQKGYTKEAEIYTKLVISRVLKSLNLILNKGASLKKQARKNQDFNFLCTQYKEKFLHPQTFLKENLCNFTPVNKHDCVGFKENKEQILAPTDGYIMFPKYPTRDELGNSLEPLSELYVLVKKVSASFFQKSNSF